MTTMFVAYSFHPLPAFFFFFFFNDTATTEIYTLSLHDALPISVPKIPGVNHLDAVRALEKAGFRIIRQGKHIVMSDGVRLLDRKSTRLNSSHLVISYAVFCLKKKKKQEEVHVDSRVTTTLSSRI